MFAILKIDPHQSIQLESFLNARNLSSCFLFGIALWIRFYTAKHFEDYVDMDFVIAILAETMFATLATITWKMAI